MGGDGESGFLVLDSSVRTEICALGDILDGHVLLSFI